MDYFTEIIGQKQALLPLKKALQTDRINHAYLFVGMAGVGKFTTALAFAKAVILESDPQGAVYIQEQVHPDFMLVEKVDTKTMIGIEQINREMETWLALKPYRASRRVVIIKDAHLLSIPAANALLKTLEEPPGHAVIILVSDETALLATIISRCQVVRFFPVDEPSISEFLLTRGVAPDRTAKLARLAQGSIATALQLAEEAGLEQFWDTAQTLIQNLSTGQEFEVFKCAEQMEKKPAMLAALLSTLLRDIYIYQVTGQKSMLVMGNNSQFCQDFKKLAPHRVQTALMNIDKLSKLYHGPVNSLLTSINISYQLWDALQ